MSCRPSTTSRSESNRAPRGLHDLQRLLLFEARGAQALLRLLVLAQRLAQLLLQAIPLREQIPKSLFEARPLVSGQHGLGLLGLDVGVHAAHPSIDRRLAISAIRDAIFQARDGGQQLHVCGVLQVALALETSQGLLRRSGRRVRRPRSPPAPARARARAARAPPARRGAPARPRSSCSASWVSSCWRALLDSSRLSALAPRQLDPPLEILDLAAQPIELLGAGVHRLLGFGQARCAAPGRPARVPRDASRGAAI